MTNYVGYWDCDYCGHTHIPGYEYDCPGCGRPRSKGVDFYLPEGAPEATPEQMALMGQDPNWYCENCDSGNKDTNNACWNCGVPKGQAVSHRVESYDNPRQIPRRPRSSQAGTGLVDPEYKSDLYDQQYFPPPTEVANPHLPYAGGHSAYPSSRHDPGPVIISVTPSWLQNHGKKVGIGAGGFLALLLVYFLFFNYHFTTATVSGFAWSRNLVVQEYKLLNQEGWSQPGDATPTGHETRQSGTRKVTDGYRTVPYTDTCYRSVYQSRTCTRNNGNGSFSTYECGGSVSQSYSCTKTRQEEIYHYEPVYSTWYFYNVWRWIKTEDHPTSGNDKEPFWSMEGTPADATHKRIQDSQSYTVNFTSQELGDFSRTYDLAIWNEIELGEVFSVKTNAVKAILEITPQAK